MKKLNGFFGLVLSLVMVGSLAAQPAKSYQVTGVTGTYTALTAEATTLPFVAGKAFHGTFFGQDKEGPFVSIVPTSTQKKMRGIPFFDFEFCGQSVNSFVVYANGAVLLGQDSVSVDAFMKTSGPWNRANLSMIYNTPGAIKSGTSYSEAEVYASATADEAEATAIRYQVAGQAGSRVLTVEFANLKVFLPNYTDLWDNPTSPTINDTIEKKTYNLSYQIKLYEAAGRMEIVYQCGQPRESQTMMLTTGIGTGTGTNDKMALQNAAGQGWATAKGTATQARKLELTPTVYPEAGWTFQFEKPAPCVAPTETDVLTAINTASMKSTEIALKATKPATTDRTLVFLSESPTWQGGLLEDGKDYAEKAIIGSDTLIKRYENSSTTAFSVSKDKLKPGRYYLHVFQCNYLCSGLMKYSAQPQTIAVETLFGAPEVVASCSSETDLQLTLKAYGDKKVLVAFSERAWDENMDGNLTSLYKPQGAYQKGDTLNKNSVATKGFPPMRVIHVGAANDVNVSDLKPGTPYHVMLWSYDDSEAGKYVYSTVCNQYGFMTPATAPVEYDFRSDAVSKTMLNNLSVTVPLPLPAGWTRTLVDETDPTNHFVVSIGLETPSDTKTDGKKRLEFYANGKSSNQVPLRQCTADIISPAFALPVTGAYRLILKAKWATMKMNNVFVDEPDALAEGDTLYIEGSADNGLSGWRRLDTLTAANWADGLAAAMPDDLGYDTWSGLFAADQSPEFRIRLVYTTARKHKFCIHSLRVEPVTACDLGYPIVYEQTAATAKSMQLRWESLNTADAYAIEYRKQSGGFTQNEWLSAGKVTEPAVAVYGLEPACGYEFRIKPLCDAASENAASVWSAASPVFYTRYGLPLEEDFQDNSLSFVLQPVKEAWYVYSGLLGEKCTEWTLPKSSYTHWTIGSATGLTAETTPRAVQINANQTEGAWLLLPPLYVSEYPVDVKVGFDLSLARYDNASRNMLKDSIKTGKRRLVLLMSRQDGCFAAADTVFQIDTAASCGYALKDLLNTRIEVPVTAVSGNVRFAFYWENLETVNTDLASNSKIYLDNIAIDYPAGAPCDSVVNLQIVPDVTSAGLSWQGEASAYDIFFQKVGSDETETLTTDETAYTLTDLRPETAYTVAIQAICSREPANLSLKSAAYGFTTQVSQCRPPQAVRCTDSTFDRLTLAFESDAARHELRYRPDTAGASDQNRLFDGLSVSLTGLNAATPYVVQLRAICAAGDSSDYTQALRFHTAAYPACPPVTGLQSEALSQSDVYLTWDKNAYHTAYTLRYAEQAAQDTVWVEAIKEPEYLLQELSAGTPYVWQIKAVCAYGQESPFSEVVEFEIEPLGNLVPDAMAHIVVYSHQGDIVIANPEGLRFSRIVMVDLQGKVLARKQDISDVHIRMACPEMPGIVLIQMESACGTRTYKLVMSNR